MKGKLVAWDPVQQKAAWTVQRPGPWNGGTLATAGNLVFEGTADGHFEAGINLQLQQFAVWTTQDISLLGFQRGVHAWRVLGRMQQDFATFPIEDDLLARGVVPHLAGCFLVVPYVFARLWFQGDNGRQEQIVAAIHHVTASIHRRLGGNLGIVSPQHRTGRCIQRDYFAPGCCEVDVSVNDEGCRLLSAVGI